MAWGKGEAVGLEDLCRRLGANDSCLKSLTILRHRRTDDSQWKLLCESLACNTALTELNAGGHAVSPASAELFSDLLCKNTSLTSLCLGNSSFGDDGVCSLARGLIQSSIASLDLENKVGEEIPQLD